MAETGLAFTQLRAMSHILVLFSKAHRVHNEIQSYFQTGPLSEKC